MVSLSNHGVSSQPVLRQAQDGIGCGGRQHAVREANAVMKSYEGKRSIDGLVVTVDGRPLPEHYEVKRFTNWGFEWTYEGASPQQLALAILYDHLGDKERASRLSEPFMKKVVADMDNDWTLTGEEIDRAIEGIEKRCSCDGRQRPSPCC